MLRSFPRRHRDNLSLPVNFLCIVPSGAVGDVEPLGDLIDRDVPLVKPPDCFLRVVGDRWVPDVLSFLLRPLHSGLHALRDQRRLELREGWP